MAFVVPILTAVSTVAGSFMQAGQAQAAAQAQANAANYNAAVAQQNANAALQAAYADKQQQDRENRASLERVRSKYLASGVELEGTPLMVLEEETVQNALESDKILHKGKVQRANFLNQANAQIYQGQVAVAAANNKAQGTILGGTLGAASGLGRSIFAGGG
jgi:ATPase subunit of ABC transporter with duplicated ATPase domains|tara:strand:- start:526 stop:1011 length:486 start_codon:yes stop_codon:yes gene_type:complete